MSRFIFITFFTTKYVKLLIFYFLVENEAPKISNRWGSMH
jgi:hypothetical protein